MSRASTAVRVVVIDDHPLVCQALTSTLDGAGAPPVQIVGCVSDAAAACDALARLRPDVALVDLGMPAPGGVAVLVAARRITPGVRLLALADDADPVTAAAALDGGADGVVAKSAEPSSLLAPLLAVAAGWAVLPPQVLPALRPSPALRQLPDLTEQECALLVAIASGASTAELSRRLLVSERTTKRLVAALLRKLRVPTRAAAAGLAGRVGLLDDLPQPRETSR